MRIMVKPIKLFMLAGVCVCAVFARAYAAQPSADTVQDKLYSVFESVKDATVKVYAQKTTYTKDEGGNMKNISVLDVGTGFLVSKDGIVMTSAFVTHRAEKIWIEWKGAIMDAKIVGFDPLTTVAIVKAARGFKSKDAPIITMDASSALPKIGTMLVAVSYEMGLPPSPRLGLASGHNIEFGGTFLPTVYVRTTILSPRGSAGGAVFDLNGKFVGMTIASIPETGGSFILPAKAVSKIRDDIILCGEPVYSWFGLRAEDAESTDGTKVVVSLVAENAPAKKGGFNVGDEIVEINSKRVTNNTELRDCTFFVRPGETAVFKIRRAGKLMKLEVLAERMSSDIIKAAESNLWGMETKKNGGAKSGRQDKKTSRPSASQN